MIYLGFETMRIHVGYSLQFDVPLPTAMLLLLHIHPGKYKLIQPEALYLEPPIYREFFIDRFGNRTTRLLASAGPLTLTNNAVVEVDGQLDDVDITAIQHPITELPHEVLAYLLSSRYCEVDKLTDFAWATFGSGVTGYQRAQAVCHWVHRHLTFGYPFARNTRSAFDAYNERQGVCRDFAHLAITLCRCLGIPARYATGYLGDIGVPFSPAPMDFSAWFEVFLGGRWYTLDARHNTPRVGRIVMAYGRDATDTALTTSFGQTTLTGFKVWTNQVAG